MSPPGSGYFVVDGEPHSDTICNGVLSRRPVFVLSRSAPGTSAGITCCTSFCTDLDGFPSLSLRKDFRRFAHLFNSLRVSTQSLSVHSIRDADFLIALRRVRPVRAPNNKYLIALKSRLRMLNPGATFRSTAQSHFHSSLVELG